MGTCTSSSAEDLSWVEEVNEGSPQEEDNGGVGVGGPSSSKGGNDDMFWDQNGLATPRPVCCLACSYELGRQVGRTKQAVAGMREGGSDHTLCYHIYS